ncbi:MAG: hypothetical protein AB1486_30240 [Planctomycetota bacterium]
MSPRCTAPARGGPLRLLAILVALWGLGCAAQRVPPSRDVLKLDQAQSSEDHLVFTITRGKSAGLRVSLTAGPLVREEFQGFVHAELPITLTVDNGSASPVEFDLAHVSLTLGEDSYEPTEILEKGNPAMFLRVIPGESRSAVLIFEMERKQDLAQRPAVTLSWTYETTGSLFSRTSRLVPKLSP